MAVKSLNRENGEAIKARFQKVQSETQPAWGEMTSAQMMRHVADLIDVSLAKVEVKDESTWFSRIFIKNLILYIRPVMPKNVKLPDAYLPQTDKSMEEERDNLFVRMDEFMETLENTPHKKIPHMFFGQMPLKAWSRLQGIHMDHHLRQFGA